jgi:ABC-type glycerol-3-phosphate transport system substrate-binding protein
MMKMIKRPLLILSSLGLFLLFAQKAIPEEAGPHGLRWMGHWKGEGGREQLVREVLEDFSFLHPDLEIEFAFAADVLPQKSHQAAAQYIADMLRSGTLRWDVIWLDPHIYQRVARLLKDPNWGARHLVDFKTIEPVLRAQRPCIINGTKGGLETTGGLLTGPYLEGAVYALYYNRELAETLHLHIPEQEMRARTMLEIARRVQQYNQTAGEPIALLSTVTGSGGIERMAYNLYLSTAPAERLNDGTAAVEAVRRFFEELGQTEPLRGTEAEQTWPEAMQALMDNRILFIADATWRSSSLQAAFPDQMHKIGIAQMPGFGPQHHYAGSFLPVWAVLKNAAGRKAGIQLMEYWCRPEIVEKWERLTRCPSGLKDGRYDAEYARDRLSEYQRRLTADRTYQQDIFLLPAPRPLITDLFPQLRALLLNAYRPQDPKPIGAP